MFPLEVCSRYSSPVKVIKGFSSSLQSISRRRPALPQLCFYMEPYDGPKPGKQLSWGLHGYIELKSLSIFTLISEESGDMSEVVRSMMNPS
jgi:hypothetical protein